MPVVAIPTTAGTGSELTIWSVLTDAQRGEKVSVGSVLNCPRVGLLDPELTVSLPPAVTAQTGMDALTHAVESYVNTASNALSEAPAEKAIQLIGRSLRRAVGQAGVAGEAMAEMLLASALAGMAFNATRLGYVHSFALPLGAKFKIPHGLVNAIMLPVVMRFNVPGNLTAFARIAALLGGTVSGLSERDGAFRAVAAVEQLGCVSVGAIRDDPSPIDSAANAVGNGRPRRRATSAAQASRIVIGRYPMDARLPARPGRPLGAHLGHRSGVEHFSKADLEKLQPFGRVLHITRGYQSLKSADALTLS